MAEIGEGFSRPVFPIWFDRSGKSQSTITWFRMCGTVIFIMCFLDCDKFAEGAVMRNAINHSSNIIGNSASNFAARAIVAAGVGHAYREHSGKRLTHVDVPVDTMKRVKVSVRGSLCERPETRCRTAEQQATTRPTTTMWQPASSEMPAAVWALLVLNRTTSA